MCRFYLIAEGSSFCYGACSPGGAQVCVWVPSLMLEFVRGRSCGKHITLFGEYSKKAWVSKSGRERGKSLDSMKNANKQVTPVHNVFI